MSANLMDPFGVANMGLDEDMMKAVGCLSIILGIFVFGPLFFYLFWNGVLATWGGIAVPAFGYGKCLASSLLLRLMLK